MRFPLKPFLELEQLSQALNDSGADLQSMLAVLLDDLQAAVPSFTGMLLTIGVDGDEPITITAVDDRKAATSMALPLHLIGALPDTSELVVYAAHPGAFADLAGHVRTFYGWNEQVQLDRHLPPPPARIGVDGAAQRSAINQAIGVLIDRGHSPDQARAELTARAEAGDIHLAQVADQILRSCESPSGPG